MNVDSHTDAIEAPPATLAQAARTWLKIGLLGFGGPAGQIALLHRFVVEEKKWASETQFLHALNYCMLLPGPEAQQLATFMGWLMHGAKGGLVAGTLFILPGFLVIAALSVVYAQFSTLTWFSGVILGLQCAVVALVIEALIRVAKRALKSPAARAIALGAFLALFAFQLPFPLVILLAAILGVASGSRIAGSNAAAIANTDATIRSDVPRLAKTGLFGIFLWLSPIAIAAWLFGAQDRLVGMGLFFAKMAVVTFGGAYAVLTYVAQEVVYHHGWIAPHTMIDGLALAETTPGPLILVLTFVGYHAAIEQIPGHPILSGIIGATYVTWITFVPSFLWIFLGAPYVERLRGNVRLTAALSGVTAAVVGVIANLALWFALHVLFAQTIEFGPSRILLPDLQSIRWPSALLTLAATLALNRWHFGLFKTLLGAVAAGCAISLTIGAS